SRRRSSTSSATRGRWTRPSACSRPSGARKASASRSRARRPVATPRAPAAAARSTSAAAAPERSLRDALEAVNDHEGGPGVVVEVSAGQLETHDRAGVLVALDRRKPIPRVVLREEVGKRFDPPEPELAAERAAPVLWADAQRVRSLVLAESQAAVRVHRVAPVDREAGSERLRLTVEIDDVEEVLALAEDHPHRRARGARGERRLRLDHLHPMEKGLPQVLAVDERRGGEGLGAPAAGDGKEGEKEDAAAHEAPFSNSRAGR